MTHRITLRLREHYCRQLLLTASCQIDADSSLLSPYLKRLSLTNSEFLQLRTGGLPKIRRYPALRYGLRLKCFNLTLYAIWFRRQLATLNSDFLGLSHTKFFVSNHCGEALPPQVTSHAFALFDAKTQFHQRQFALLPLNPTPAWIFESSDLMRLQTPVDSRTSKLIPQNFPEFNFRFLASKKQGFLSHPFNSLPSMLHENSQQKPATTFVRISLQLTQVPSYPMTQTFTICKLASAWDLVLLCFLCRFLSVKRFSFHRLFLFLP